MKIIHMYPDGGYTPSTGIGAMSFVVIQDRECIYEFSKSFNKKEKPLMTINRMELGAVIKSLDWLSSNGYSPKENIVFVHTDSFYVHQGVNKWMERRLENSKNKGMWVYLNTLLKHVLSYDDLYVQWVESHSGNKWNDRAHELCTLSMKNYVNNKIDVQQERIN